MANIITTKRKSPSEKTILLFSGGMDSLIMDFLLRPDILLFCTHDNKYQERELSGLNKLSSFLHGKLIFDNSLSLGSLERDDAIIPARNLYFILVAANYGEIIYFGSVYGDRSLDKSIEFFKKSSEMLSYLYADQHWCKQHKFAISAPFKENTKSELVNIYLTAGGSEKALFESYSCYEGKVRPCGICKPCFRKWVALKNNKVKIPLNYFENNPSKAPWLNEIIPLLDGGYRGKEDFEIIQALNL